MGMSGDWRDATWFTVAFVVFAVVVPSAAAVFLGDSFGGLARATAASVCLAGLAAFGAYTRRQMRGRGRRQRNPRAKSPRSS